MRTRSSSGNPNSSPSTRRGSGQANASTMSTVPRPAKPSIRRAAISSMRGSSASMRRGVNARATRPRMRSWSGGSSSMMYGISGYPSASTSSTSRGSDADDDFSAPVDENVRWSFSTASTSSCRVTTQRSSAGAWKTGCSRRASASTSNGFSRCSGVVGSNGIAASVVTRSVNTVPPGDRRQKDQNTGTSSTATTPKRTSSGRPSFQ